MPTLAPALLIALTVVLVAAFAVWGLGRRGPDRFCWDYLHGDWGRAAARENFSPDAPGACAARCACASWGRARAADYELEALRMLAGAA